MIDNQVDFDKLLLVDVIYDMLNLIYEIVCILCWELFMEIIFIGFVGVFWIVVIYMIVG